MIDYLFLDANAENYGTLFNVKDNFNDNANKLQSSDVERMQEGSTVQKPQNLKIAGSNIIFRPNR